MGGQAETIQGNVGLLFENAPVGRKIDVNVYARKIEESSKIIFSRILPQKLWTKEAEIQVIKEFLRIFIFNYILPSILKQLALSFISMV